MNEELKHIVSNVEAYSAAEVLEHFFNDCRNASTGDQYDKFEEKRMEMWMLKQNLGALMVYNAASEGAEKED